MKPVKKRSIVSPKKQIVGFRVIENECIWMKAGIVNYRLCDNAYDCNTCAFDKAMGRAMKREDKSIEKSTKPSWAEYLKRHFDGANRPCRHSLTGRIDAPKICTLNYECYHCPFDQWLYEMDEVEDMGAPKYKLASGFRMAEGYYYHMGHSWARFESGGRVRVGFDDFVSHVFGSMQTIQFPPLGSELIQNEVGWTFNRNDHQAAMLSPVTGTVLAVNHTTIEHPEVSHEDPYQHGWLFILEPEKPKKNLKGLYYGEESFRWMEQETQRLLGLIGPEYESLAATGGGIINDIYGTYEGMNWDALVELFLHTAKI